MNIYLNEKQIKEICSRGNYWKEVSGRDGNQTNIYFNEAREIIQSIGFYNILAILNNYAKIEQEKLNKLK